MQSAGTAGAAGRSDRSSEFACPGLEEILEWEHVVCLMQTICEFRPELDTLRCWSQQRAKEVQSRDYQSESKVSQQNPSSELFDEGVHKPKNAVHQQSSFCNSMGRDVLAMNSSLRESATRNSQEIWELSRHQQPDEKHFAHASELMSGLLNTQREDELQLPNPEGHQQSW